MGIAKVRLFGLFFLVLSITTSIEARQTTLPPSIALRTEVSYVSIVLLEALTKATNNSIDLSFLLVEDIHNTADTVTVVNVAASLADQLKKGAEYVIAYEKVTKLRDNESKFYSPLAGGPQLMRVEGAYPAIFLRNKPLIERLKSNPQQAQSDPDG